MDAKQKGKLILKTIPDGKGREAVIIYLSRLFKNVPQEKVAALIKKTPVTLNNNVTLSIAQQVIVNLKKVGATAIFLPHTPSESKPSKPTSSKRKAPPKKRTRKTQTADLKQPLLNALSGVWHTLQKWLNKPWVYHLYLNNLWDER